MASTLKPDERENALHEACMDSDLVTKILTLLENEDTDQFLETPRHGLKGVDLGQIFAEHLGDEPEISLEQLNAELENYELLSLLGCGGMGRVYLANQLGPIERKVAIKFTGLSGLSDAEEELFLREQQSLAKLTHPNIAQIHEVGSTRGNAPFFVMEYVDGIPITDYCDEKRLAIRDRLALFDDVLDAIQYAHRRRVLHLDIKPSNVLVTEINGRAVPKIIDFGIAQNLDTELDRALRGIGTPNYASPELLDPKRGSLALDTMSDVYGLGCLLWKLLAGRPPVKLTGRSTSDLYKQLIRLPVVLPSVQLANEAPEFAQEVADKRNTNTQRLISALKIDLDAICLKAVSKEQDDRYGDALELGQEIKRYLANRPVKAVQQTTSYKVAKYAKRNWIPITAIAAVVTVLLGSTISVATALVESRQSEFEARQSEQRASQVAAFLQDLINFSSPYEQRKLASQQSGTVKVSEVKVPELMREGIERANDQLTSQPQVRADLLHVMGNILRGFTDPDAPLEPLETALELRMAELGPTDQKTLETQHSLALAYERLGRYDAAESLYQQSYDGLLDLLGPDNRQTVLVKIDLAQLQFTRRREDKASTAILEEALADAERIGLGLLLRAEILNSLGFDAHFKGRHKEAIAYIRRSHDLNAEHFPEVHTSMALMKHNLAFMMIPAGRVEEAELLVERAIEIWAETTEPTYWRNANSRGLLGVVRMEQGRYEEAETLLLNALEGVTEGTGPETVYTRFIQEKLADLYRRLGRHEEEAKHAT